MSRLLRSSGTLEQAYAGRNNGIGVIRLRLTMAVAVAHSTSLGLGRENLGLSAFAGQTNVGTLAVFAFFVLPGWLITRSARPVRLVPGGADPAGTVGVPARHGVRRGTVGRPARAW